MSVPIQPISELTNRARHALVQKPDVIDAMRVLNQFRAGSDAYTVEREQIPGKR